MKIIEDLGQILVVLHTLLVIIEMPPRLNKQSGSDLVLLEYVVCLLCATGIKTFTEIQLIHLHESEIFGEHEIVMSLMREFLYLQQSLEDL